MQFGVKPLDLALDLPLGVGLQEFSFRPHTVNGSRTRVVEAWWTLECAMAAVGAAQAPEGPPSA